MSGHFINELICSNFLNSGGNECLDKCLSGKAGLAATDPELVPYGTMVATFYSGTGCLLCPSLLYALVNLLF